MFLSVSIFNIIAILGIGFGLGVAACTAAFSTKNALLVLAIQVPAALFLVASIMSHQGK